MLGVLLQVLKSLVASIQWRSGALPAGSSKDSSFGKPNPGCDNDVRSNCRRFMIRVRRIYVQEKTSTFSKHFSTAKYNTGEKRKDGCGGGQKLKWLIDLLFFIKRLHDQFTGPVLEFPLQRPPAKGANLLSKHGQDCDLKVKARLWWFEMLWLQIWCWLKVTVHLFHVGIIPEL